MKIEQVRVAELKPYEKNARTHPESQIKQIARSIEEFGFNNPILATREGRIIAGHGRVEAAKVLNLDTVPVVRIEHLSPEQIQAYTLADNQLALTSKWDDDALAEEIKELYGVGFDLDLLGFDPSELAAMLEVKPEIDESLLDEVPEVEEVAITKAGDLWELGDHHLLCGDSTRAEDVALVLNGDEIDLVMTDPPYNLAQETDLLGKSRSKALSTLADANWDQGFDPEVFLSICYDKLKKDAWIAVFTSNILFGTIDGFLRKKNGYCNFFCWCKPNPMPSPMKKCFVSAVELCVLGKKGKPIFNYPEGTHALNYMVQTKKGYSEHPTAKTVEVIAELVSKLSRAGAIVFDAFLGSGTTLIAAEQLGRKCRGIEISPQYCDVIIKRWQKLTGKRALNLNTGDYFGGTTE